MSTPKPNTHTRVCLIDDHRILSQGIATMLSAEPDMEVVAQCHTVSDGLSAAATHAVDLFLLDLRLDGEDGFLFLQRFKNAGLPGRVVILAGQAEPADVVRLVGLGVSGIILKSGAPESLLKCIRQVAAGEPFFSPEHLSIILRSISEPPEELLTEKERKVLRLLLEGSSNKEIAETLLMRETSVKFMLQTLFRKTGAHNRSQLVRIALEKYRDELL